VAGAGYGSPTFNPAAPMTDKPKARLPRGFADRGPATIAATNRMLDAIRRTYELYGFEAVETPFVESTDALGKFLPDQDRPNEGVFSFKDDDESWLSLRYDLTAPLARYVAENFDRLPKPYRSYRAGWVFRNEKPGPGRFRQFMQFDADTVGSKEMAADAEICMIAAHALEELGMKENYVIKVNNRKVLDGVMDAIGLGDANKAGQRLAVLRAIDKYDRLGEDGVRALLGAGRCDESGDFTTGAELAEEQINMVVSFAVSTITTPLQDVTGVAPEERLAVGEVHPFNPMFRDGSTSYFAESNSITLSDLRRKFGSNSLSREGLDELQQICELCEAGGFGYDKVKVDTSVVRGLEYYTGPVFEAELTFTVSDDEGRPVRFGSVGGGGRYDGLVGRFRSEPVPATGFSIGVSRLYAALQAIKSPIVAAPQKAGPVVVLVLDRDRIADYQRLVAELRGAGVQAELYLGSSGLKAQMKYADRRGAPVAVIQGSDERARGEVQIKDLVEGAEAAKAIATNREWKAARPAQETVPEDGMVAKVREVLARHR
jgi:histidyl-tRNA synthetase